MAWNDVASNQMVSYADTIDSGFTLQPGQTNPGTLQCMTKNDALTKYVLDSSYMTNYASNQLVPKSVWVNPSGFLPLNQTSRSWTGITANLNGDVYACAYYGDIYKQTGGTGNFVALGQTYRAWSGIAAAPNGDIYACVYLGDIYKQTGGTGNFVALGQTYRAWDSSMAASISGNIYASADSIVYKLTNGSGTFTQTGQPFPWGSSPYTIAAAIDKDIYVGTLGDIYKQTNETGDFVALGQTTRTWIGMTAAFNGDVYACVAQGDIYKQTGGTGNFVALGQTTRQWQCMAAAPNGDIYACVDRGDIYKLTNSSPATTTTSVTFSGATGYSQTPGGSYSGIVLIQGASANFAAYAQAAGFGTNSASTSITINGNTRIVSRNQSEGGGTTTSTYFTLPPGYYAYSIDVSVQSQYGASGGIVYTQ